MRILSQEGRIDLPYENFSLSITQDNCIVATRDVVARPSEMLIGIVAKYSTESKARKAMEMLREEYTFEKQFETICNGTTDYPSRPTYYFQFPQDDKAEVSL